MARYAEILNFGYMKGSGAVDYREILAKYRQQIGERGIGDTRREAVAKVHPIWRLRAERPLSHLGLYEALALHHLAK